MFKNDFDVNEPLCLLLIKLFLHHKLFRPTVNVNSIKIAFQSYLFWLKMQQPVYIDMLYFLRDDSSRK